MSAPNGRWVVVVAVAVVLAVGCVPTGTAEPVDVSGIELQGHRGARGLRPENTLPSFETALDLGVDTLELDMHLTADGVVVVWHDDRIEPDKCRLVGNLDPSPPDPVDRPRIAELTAAQVAGYRCDLNPDPDRFPDQRPEPTALAGDDYGIPTLAEVFEFVAGYAAAPDKTAGQRERAAQVGFNIETKRDPSDPGAIGDGFDGSSAGPFELAVLEAVDAAGVADRVTIQSFDHRSLWTLHELRPELSLAALTRRGDRVDVTDLARRGATIWSPDRRVVDADAVALAHDAGLRVIPWTVNDAGEARALISVGVDGIITDRPDRFTR